MTRWERSILNMSSIRVLVQVSISEQTVQSGYNIADYAGRQPTQVVW